MEVSARNLNNDLKFLALPVLASQGSMEISARNLNNDLKADSIKTNDHISKMPEDVLTLIISFLTMRDAVRASVLSSGWRYLFAFTPNLYFDPLTVFGIKYGKYGSSKHLWECKFRFILAVDQFLQQYRSRKIYSFKLNYCLGNESACHIDRWISFAVTVKTEKLHLDFSFIPEDCERYKLSCHLLRKASHLKHLLLESCMLRSSLDFRLCLNSLKTIDLKCVYLDQSALNSILSGCTNLEWLRIEKCSLPVNFFIHGPFLCLKLLALDNCFGAKKIEISSIGLITFEYIGRMKTLTFLGISSVEKMLLRCTDYDKLTKDLPQMQRLSLFLFSHQGTQMPVKKNKLFHLKELELILGLVTNFDLLSLAAILNACPCLQKFRLEIRWRMWGFEGQLVKWRYATVLYYQLKEVEISGFCDIASNSLELAIYLLRRAVRLERMIINLRDKYKIDEGKKRVHGVLSKKVKPNVELIVR